MIDLPESHEDFLLIKFRALINNERANLKYYIGEVLTANERATAIDSPEKAIDVSINFLIWNGMEQQIRDYLQPLLDQLVQIRSHYRSVDSFGEIVEGVRRSIRAGGFSSFPAAAVLVVFDLMVRECVQRGEL